MKIGLCTISSKDRSVADVLELAGEAGYDGVEVWGQDHVGSGSAETCASIVEVATEQGLEIPVYGSYLRCGTDAFDDQLEHELAVTDRLGADLIRVWAGRQEYGDHDPSYWDRVRSDLERVTDRAAAYSVGVTVEKHAGTLTNTLEGAQRLLETVDSDRCGLNYQPGFAVSADEIEREIDALAPLANHLHLQAVRSRGERERAALAEAFFDLEGLIESFLDSGYDGYAMVEFVTDSKPYRRAITDDLQTVRSIRDRALSP